MKYAFATGLLAAALATTGCSSGAANADANTLMSTDFDTLVGWVPEPGNATLTNEKAHSGRYSLMVDAAHEYSLTYREPLGALTPTRLRKITVSAWTMVPSPASQASLVVAVSNPAAPDEKPVVWESIALGKDAKPGEWTEIKKEIVLPDNVLPTHALGCYLWRTSGDQPAYLDDLKVVANP